MGGVLSQAIRLRRNQNEKNRNLHKSDRFYKKVRRMDQRGEWGRVRRIQKG